jgi:tetratricopeptide (TPR) repeat protein
MEAAITVAQDAVDGTPTDDPHLAGRLNTLAMTLMARFERTGQAGDLDAAVPAAREAVRGTPAGHPDRAGRLSNLGIALLNEFQRTGQPEDLDAAVTAAREAVEITPAGHPDHLKGLNTLGNALWTRSQRTDAVSDLDAAVTAAQEAVDTIPDDHPTRAACLNNLDMALQTRFVRTRQPADLDAAVSAARQAADRTPTGHATRTERLNSLGNALLTRFVETGQPDDLIAAMTVLWQAVAGLTAGPEQLGQSKSLDTLIVVMRIIVDNAPDNHAFHLHGLGVALHMRYLRSGDPADGNDAITAHQQAVEACPADGGDHAKYLSGLAQSFSTRYLRDQQVGDLEAAIDSLRRVVAAAPTDPAYRSQLAQALLYRYAEAGQVTDLDTAVAAAKFAVDETPLDHPDRPEYQLRLAKALTAQNGRPGRPGDADVDRAITAAGDAVNDMPHNCPGRAANLNALGGVLHARYEESQDLGDLDAAIAAARESAAASSADPLRALSLSLLASLLRDRYEKRRELVDLDEAIEAGQRAVTIIGPNHADRATHLYPLACALLFRLQRTGLQADADAAIDVAKELVQITAPDHPKRASYLSVLSSALIERYQRQGELSDLDEALIIAQQVVDVTPVEDPNRVVHLANLGNALEARYLRTSRITDVDSALEYRRQTTVADSTNPEHQAALAATLLHRYSLSSDTSDLAEAVNVAQKTVDVTATQHPRRSAHLSVLSAALSFANPMSFPNPKSSQPPLDFFDAAITAARQAVEAVPTEASGRNYPLLNLAKTLKKRFMLTNEPNDLDEAIAAVQQVVATSPAHRRLGGDAHVTLADALLARHNRTKQPADLDGAITAAREAIKRTEPDEPSHLECLSVMARALLQRHQITGRRADLDEAIDYQHQAVGVTTAPALNRMVAASLWGAYAAQAANDTAAGIEGFAAAVELMTQAAWQFTDRSMRERAIAFFTPLIDRNIGGLASFAAQSAIAAGQPRRAVELLELGRSVLWNHQFRLQGDLGRLSADHPELAEALERARVELDQAPDIEPSLFAQHTTAPVPSALGNSGEEALHRRRSAARRWHQLLAEVRAIEGFENFLTPTPLNELREAASGGPVIVLNATGLACQALILSADSDSDIEVVDLPDLKLPDAAARVNAFRRTLSQDRGRRHLDPRRDLNPIMQEPDQAVLQLLAWLWDTAAEPVLAALGYTSAPKTVWPRVWWCPTGPLAQLPIHAAGRYPVGDSAESSAAHVPGRVVSSYTPTLAALIRARQQQRPETVRQLAVGMPVTPEHPPLPAVEAELDVLSRILPPPTRGRHLVGSDATRAAVLDAIPEFPWLHLACHGTQNSIDPSRSGFALQDGLLTIAELTDVQPRYADLAFLSACETATGSAHLPDESLHLAAALQLIGYRHVIATMWTIADAPAPGFADSIYSHLTARGHADSADAAQALHDAVAKLRTIFPDDPLIWAPYIHIGP